MSKAKDIIIPKSSGVFRTIFLYVGQGDSTLLIVPDGAEYKFILIDCNLDKEAEGINLTKLFSDLLDDRKLDIFINTHPHKDHIGGIKEIYEEIGIDELWHSGHIPGGKHKEEYKELEYVIDKLNDESIYLLKGSRSINKLDDNDYKLGDIDFNVLAPAEYVTDEIEGEDPDARYSRIHEQCGVIRFTYGATPANILLTGDSDLCAWKNHITDYHEERIASEILSASHHGSRTYFKNDKDDEAYRDHIDKINPSYITVSAPKQSESKHDHPHEDAMDLYNEYVDKDNLIHMGDYKGKRVSVIVDIYEDGEINIDIDEDLWNEYKFTDDGDGNDKSEKAILGAYPITKLDNKPMG